MHPKPVQRRRHGAACKSGQPGKSAKAGVQTEQGGQDEMGVVTPADYSPLLKAVYQRADVSTSRNLIGLTHDQPVPEMKKRLMADIAGQRRCDACAGGSAWRGAQGDLALLDLPGDQLFLGAVKAMPPDGKCTPPAELNWAMP